MGQSRGILPDTGREAREKIFLKNHYSTHSWLLAVLISWFQGGGKGWLFCLQAFSWCFCFQPHEPHLISDLAFPSLEPLWGSARLALSLRGIICLCVCTRVHACVRPQDFSPLLCQSTFLHRNFLSVLKVFPCWGSHVLSVVESFFPSQLYLNRGSGERLYMLWSLCLLALEALK